MWILCYILTLCCGITQHFVLILCCEHILFCMQTNCWWLTLFFYNTVLYPNIILEAVLLLLLLRSVRNEFYIQFALPISPEIMDGFSCSRCPNDRIEVPDMMRLFAGGATTPLVVKIWTKQPLGKIEYLGSFDCNFVLFRGKIWLWLFYNCFCVRDLRVYTKNLKSFQPKMKAWRRFSLILISFCVKS